MAYAMQLQQAAEQQQASDRSGGGQPGGNVLANNLSFHPPGSEKPLLDNVSFNLKPNQLGLIIGRSGSGKTTLLQLLAGLSEQTAGQIFIHRPAPGDHASGLFVPTHIEERMQQVGLVFQFPERHFLGDDVMAEMTFTWPRDVAYWGQRQAMAVRMQRVVDAVGLSGIPFNISPAALSGGQQRRLALALQLVRGPSVLLLDEPLAGLDWHARREVVALLRELKREATLLVVSHDLADIAPLVDCAWRMEMGGKMEAVQWPPDSLSDVED